MVCGKRPEGGVPLINLERRRLVVTGRDAASRRRAPCHGDIARTGDPPAELTCAGA